MFRRICERCADLVVCSRHADGDLTCSRCGGTLVGPVALPTPGTYRERCAVLSSPHYTGAVAERPRR
jgi:ribosomal protein L37AE/L43A